MGFLIPVKNAPTLVQAMLCFIEQLEQIEKMGYESYKMAQEKFDANKVNKRLLNILGL